MIRPVGKTIEVSLPVWTLLLNDRRFFSFQDRTHDAWGFCLFGSEAIVADVVSKLKLDKPESFTAYCIENSGDLIEILTERLAGGTKLVRIFATKKSESGTVWISDLLDDLKPS